MSGANVARAHHLSRVALPFAAMLAGVLALCGLSWMTPSVAYAADQVNDPIVIDGNTPAEGASGPGWEWEWAGSAGTLTLDGADIVIPDTYSGNASAAIVLPAGSTIHLVGENSVVTAVDSEDPVDAHSAIACAGDLIITGDASSSASLRAEGDLGRGIFTEGDLSIGIVELNILAETMTAAGQGATGVYVAGDLVINNDAIVAVAGGTYGLSVQGGANITDARQVKLGTNGGSGTNRSALIGGEVMISGVEDVIVADSTFEAMGVTTIAASHFSTSAIKSDLALHLHQGLDITDGSFVEVTSRGTAIEVNNHLVVQNSELRAEGEGDSSTAIAVTGDLTIADSTVTALGDEAAADTLGIHVRAARGSDYAGTLTLSGNPFITAQGSAAAIQFISSAEDWEGDHVVLDPAIGALEGGMLTYAERVFTDHSGDYTMSAWTYATDKVSIDDNGVISGASQRVVIGAENAVLFVTDNGDPATGLESVKAIDANGTEYSAVEWLDGSHVGYYRFPQNLPAGAYMLEFGSGYETADGAVVSVREAGPEVFSFDFCTVEMKQVNNAWAWLVQPSTGERVSVLEHMLVGAELEIGAQLDKGYAFVEYRATGAAPMWENGDSGVANQTVVVEGATVIEPTVKAEGAAPGTGDEGKDQNPGTGTTPDAPPSGDKMSSLPTTGDALGGVVVPVAIVAALAMIAAVAAACKRIRGMR